jgi:hypothetical protein
MMDPQTAIFLGGRVDPHQDRDAEQAAALRDAQAGHSSARSVRQRVQAILGRGQAPASASCDCTEG